MSPLLIRIFRSGINAAVLRALNFDRSGFFAISEEELCVRKELRLIGFDEELLVRSPLHQALGELALAEESIAGDGLALRIDAMEKRKGRFRFVGLFGPIIALLG